jgi:hypothetical protein
MAHKAIQVYRSYHMYHKVLVSCWYKNGSLEAFHQFCIQNQDKPISIKLMNRSEPVKGALCNYYLNLPRAQGLFLLLTDSVFQPAYYGLEGIESLHLELNEALSPWAESTYPDEIFPSEIMASRNLALRSAK